MKCTIAGVNVRVHALLPLLMLLSAQMGQAGQVLSLMAALLAHEAAHVLSAKWAGICVAELELTPLGAAARLDGIWSEGALRAAAVALAGPLINFLLIGLTGALFYAGFYVPAWSFLRANFLLMAVNLLPALPLDGGRVLCALLSGRLGVRRAVLFGTIAGYLLSAVLFLAALWRGIAEGIWNIALIAAAVYIAACACREGEFAASVSAEGLVHRREQLSRRGSLPVRLLAVPEDTAAQQAMRLLRPGVVHLFLLHDGAMRISGMVEEKRLLQAFSGLAGMSLKDLLQKQSQRSWKHA